jgi:hypothetical protein
MFHAFNLATARTVSASIGNMVISKFKDFEHRLSFHKDGQPVMG